MGFEIEGDDEEISFTRTTGAILSPCGVYRYKLWRTWSGEPKATFIMLNPSTADASEDDPTIRKCIGFAHRWGCGGIIVVNLFALRSTDPKGLLQHKDPVGPENDATIHMLIKEASGPIIAAWGAFKAPTLQERVEDFHRLCEGIPVECLGKSASGAPRHPLMLGYTTAREPYLGIS